MTTTFNLDDTDEVVFSLTGLDAKGASVALDSGFTAAWTLADPDPTGAVLTVSDDTTTATVAAGVPDSNLLLSVRRGHQPGRLHPVGCRGDHRAGHGRDDRWPRGWHADRGLTSHEPGAARAAERGVAPLPSGLGIMVDVTQTPAGEMLHTSSEPRPSQGRRTRTPLT